MTSPHVKIEAYTTGEGSRWITPSSPLSVSEDNLLLHMQTTHKHAVRLQDGRVFDIKSGFRVSPIEEAPAPDYFFKRELRYLVIKVGDMRKYLTQEEERNLLLCANKVDRGRKQDGKEIKRFAVVANTWPEYDTVWQMIKARVLKEQEEKRIAMEATKTKVNYFVLEQFAREHGIDYNKLCYTVHDSLITEDKNGN